MADSAEVVGFRVWDGPKATLIAWPTFLEAANGPKVEWKGDGFDGECLVEFAGRTCYQSYHNPIKRTTADYIRHVLSEGHGSIFEHASYSFFIEGVSRSLTHELIRHRAGTAVSQLSQRFVESVGMVIPPAVIELGDAYVVQWEQRAKCIVSAYRGQLESLKEAGVRGKALREAARSLLPNAAETKLVFTANLRAWRHMIELRMAPGADAEIRRLFGVILGEPRREAPAVFADFSPEGVPTWSKV